MIEFTHWPQDAAQRYRELGLWAGLPLTEILERQAREHPQGIAVICGERMLSYRELDEQAEQLAQALARRGLGVGDTALVQLPNVAELYIAFFGLLKAGVAPVNALFSHQRLELTAYAQQLQPKLLVASASHPLFANDAFARELAVPHTMVLGADGFREQPQGIGPRPQHAPASEVAFFQLSGGSTGTPKLIPRTHDDYYYSVRRSAEICRLDRGTRFLCALPAGHNFLLSSPGALGVFHAGGTVVLAPAPEPLACFALIERHGVNMAALVPSAVALWLQAAQQPERRAQLSSLRLLQVGGASFAEALARRVPQELGCALQQVFGMAEGLVNYTRLDDPDDVVYATQGRPMSDADEVRVLDADGQQVADGETGMLATRGPYTFRGYYRAAEHNARVFDADGFYHTGDLVQRSADGNLRVVGRVKDQINRGGEKIAAEEVENLLLRHPGVLQAALISVPHALLGEMSCACIVPRGDSLRPVELRKYLRGLGVADYKLPDRFEMLDRLPLTAVGKTDKLALRASIPN
ncbi:(2,3-dihydroxybenzoyl)adenylate synthase [Pseudoduganella sp. R-32]|uniref:(2,3-dihydroxybenzoyl)adenylate synthase n=1 Tax=Pseudoduganella sp. R-32 TaxID=3404061 RepID=UPI003CEEE3B0